MSDQFVISIMSRDRIGIVAEVSSAISELGGDIADLRQSVLRGYFSMILLAAFPRGTPLETIERALVSVNRPGVPVLGVLVQQVEDIAQSEDGDVLQSAYVLTASGSDRIGFVAAVSSFCAANQINILDLSTAVADGLYTMMLLIDLGRCDVGDVRARLKRFAQETGFEIVLQHHDIFRATQEVGGI